MTPEKLSQKVFIAGFLVGVVIAIIPVSRNIFDYVTKLFIPPGLSGIFLTLACGIVFGSIMYGNMEVYRKEKALGLVKLWGVLGLLVMAMFLLLKYNTF